jgi:hypothetical protein
MQLLSLSLSYFLSTSSCPTTSSCFVLLVSNARTTFCKMNKCDQCRVRLFVSIVLLSSCSSIPTHIDVSLFNRHDHRRIHSKMNERTDEYTSQAIPERYVYLYLLHHLKQTNNTHKQEREREKTNERQPCDRILTCESYGRQVSREYDEQLLFDSTNKYTDVEHGRHNT